MTPTPFYQDEAVCIYHGDCREVLPFLPKTDLLLTDPPYGIGEARGKNKSRGFLAVSRDYGTSDWDDSAPPRWLFDALIDHTKHQIIFGGNCELAVERLRQSALPLEMGA